MTTVRRLLVADLLGAIGCGLTQPYTVVFLHLGQGIPVAVATALLGLVAAAGLVGYPVGAGWRLYRVGRRSGRDRECVGCSGIGRRDGVVRFRGRTGRPGTVHNAR